MPHLTKLFFIIIAAFGISFVVFEALLSTNVPTQVVTSMSTAPTREATSSNAKAQTATLSPATTTAHIASTTSARGWKYYAYNNFLIPYPALWHAVPFCNDRGCTLELSPPPPFNYAVSSDFSTNRLLSVDVLDPKRYVAGPDEYAGASSTGVVYLPYFKTNAYKYGPTNRTSYVLFSQRGGLAFSSPAASTFSVAAYYVPGININSVGGLAKLILKKLTYTATTTDPDLLAATSTVQEQYLGHYLSKTASHVYYYNLILTDVDPATFSYTYVGTSTPATGIATILAKDASQIFVLAPKTDGRGIVTSIDKDVFDGADPNTFRFVGQSYYAVDKNHVFYCRNRGIEPMPQCAIIAGADPRTFSLYPGQNLLEGSNWPFARDKSHVYVQGDVLPGANPDTFNFKNYTGCMPYDPAWTGTGGVCQS